MNVQELQRICRQHRKKQFLIGGIAALIIAIAWCLGYRLFAAVAACWLTYRIYKLVGRRCKKCGRVFGILRIGKIHLAADETKSIRSPNGRPRWWIRRVCTKTIVVCECGMKELVKLTKGPISIWHVWWVWYTDRRQYYDDPDLAFVLANSSRKIGTFEDLKPREGLDDTPPVVLAAAPAPEPETPNPPKG